MTDHLTGIPDRVDAEPPSLPAEPDPVAEAAAREHNRTRYLAFVRAGLSDRLSSVLTWLEVQADFWQQDSGGDPRFSPTDPRAQNYGDPYAILDDAAARIEFSFNVGDRDLGWRDGAMLSAGEFGNLLAALDNQIWILENQPDFAANVAGVLRGVVSSLNGYRSRTVTGCSRKPAIDAAAGAVACWEAVAPAPAPAPVAAPTITAT